VILHTSGFPQAPLGPPDWGDREKRLAAFSKWRLNWEPGTRFEYHPTSAHWVLAEIITRLTGVDHREFVRTRIAEPLGLPNLQLGVPEDQRIDFAEVAPVGEPVDPDELERVIGIRELPVTEVNDETLMYFNDPVNRAVGVPGAGAVTTAADLALFYQALLHNDQGLWKPDVLADATGRVRNTFPDPWMGVPANRGLGVVIAGDDGKASLRGFGKTVSGRAFGHDGAAGQQAWADPESGISFVYLTNGNDRNLIRQWKRGTAVSSLAGACTAPL
jgi:CubicO group peptidase (beta-lactamase class C family)